MSRRDRIVREGNNKTSEQERARNGGVVKEMWMKTDESEQKDKRARVRETGEESVVFGDNQRQREGRCELLWICVCKRDNICMELCTRVWEKRETERGQRSVWQKAFVVKVAILNLLLVPDGSTSLCPSLVVWPSFSLSLHLYDWQRLLGRPTHYLWQTSSKFLQTWRSAMPHRWKEFFSQGQHTFLFVLWGLHQWLCMFKPVNYKTLLIYANHFSTRFFLFVYSKTLWHSGFDSAAPQLPF